MLKKYDEYDEEPAQKDELPLYALNLVIMELAAFYARERQLEEIWNLGFLPIGLFLIRFNIQYNIWFVQMRSILGKCIPHFRHEWSLVYHWFGFFSASSSVVPQYTSRVNVFKK